MKRLLRCALVAVWMLLVIAAPSVWANTPIVRAVLFYSPTCPHCHKVITEDLPPLFEKYGAQLQIVGIDTTQPTGQALYQAAVQRFNIAQERLGVPTLIVGDVVLVGSVEIPQQFPGLIETYLAQGGVDWPDIPGLSEALAAAQPTPTLISEQATPAKTPTLGGAPTATSTLLTPTTAATASPHPTPTESRSGLIVEAHPPASIGEKLARDPLGNTLAIVVLTGMIFSVGWVVGNFRRTDRQSFPAWGSWTVPVLIVIGLGVAGYLAYVETARVTAVCGPVGDCNTVQQSEYARLFGLIPIGMLGVIGYLAIGIAWFVSCCGRGLSANFAAWALFNLTLFGTLFSIYLTFLEPFVIGATCAWCLTSAIIMTALLWLTPTPGQQVLSKS